MFDFASSAGPCPPQCCNGAISVDLAEHLICHELAVVVRRKEIENATANRVYCSNADCATFLVPDSIQNNLAACPECERVTCSLCKLEQHGAAACVADEEAERQQAHELAREHGWQRCPGFEEMVERIDGCNEMRGVKLSDSCDVLLTATHRCRCGARFCYVCGARWTPQHYAYQRPDVEHAQAGIAVPDAQPQAAPVSILVLQGSHSLKISHSDAHQPHIQVAPD